MEMLRAAPLCALVLLAQATPALASDPLPAEPIPRSLELADEYPPTWVFVHDFHFDAILDGKVAIVDVAAETRPYKGHIGAGQFGSFAAARTRPELYTTQTFMSRRTYGERLDVLTIFDRKTLLPQGEVILPPRRLQVVTQRNAFQLTPDERWAFVMNFTPAASVTVVDLVARQVLGEVATPACNFVFPTGGRGFSSLCSDGSLATWQLGEDGGVASSSRTKPFIDIDADPLYVKNAVVDGITYFPSFRGRVQPVDFRGTAPALGEAWPLVSDDLKAEAWAPGGWQVVAGDERGRLYVLMHPDAEEGTHKYGGTEVWVFEAKTGKRLRRIPLRRFSVSIAVTSDPVGHLVVTNDEMELDVYRSGDGQHLRTLHVGASANPMVVVTR